MYPIQYLFAVRSSVPVHSEIFRYSLWWRGFPGRREFFMGEHWEAFTLPLSLLPPVHTDVIITL